MEASWKTSAVGARRGSKNNISSALAAMAGIVAVSCLPKTKYKLSIHTFPTKKILGRKM